MDTEPEIKPIESHIDSSNSKDSKNFFADYGTPFSILLGALIIAASIYVSNGGTSVGPAKLAGNLPGNQPQPTPVGAGGKVEVSADDDPFLGANNAPVTLTEFSDFQCPFCRALWRDSLPQIKSKYIDTGKVKLVYRDFPLDIHPAAQISAEAAECADDQGKFWEFHDKLFQEQDKQGTGTIQYTEADLKNWAQENGLNTGKFSECLDSGKYSGEVQKDMQDGIAAGVTGTPATFINGKLVKGAVPFANFEALIEAELKQ